ncbi:outer membrane protein assembly factor BamD, partial [Pelagibacteraceae bacterium]|nr:outer membrane protein assembly factor BamD [Pelagibacteraceae bacterium]
MKIIFKILLIFTIIFQISCSKKVEKSLIDETDIELQMIQLYQEGYEELTDGDVLYAAKKFNEAELIFPQSKWAPRSALMAAYSYYSQDYYSDAIYEAERYLKKYPNHSDHDYAHFILAMCYYENIIDEKRDLDPLLKAKKEFEFILEKYPETDFAMDATFKIELINDRLAGKEMFIARHYLKSEKWIPAINRYKVVATKYETTVYIEEALHRLVEIY